MAKVVQLKWTVLQKEIAGKALEQAWLDYGKIKKQWLNIIGI